MFSLRPLRNLLFIFAVCLWAVAAPAATEYLILTTDALSPSFQTLADRRAQQGLQSQVLTIETIQSGSVPGRDLAEQIRNAIADVFADGSLRYVLLGGDSNLIPARLAHSDFYAPESEIPSDLYYAALDGNWDLDGDSIFAEATVDAADLDPDLALGRAPVQDVAQAAAFVAKLVAYEDPANAAHLSSALILGEVLFPSAWQPGQLVQLDGAMYAEALAAILQSSGSTMTGQRLYENYLEYPGSSALTRAQALLEMDAGVHCLVIQVGHGFENAISLGDATMTALDVQNLANGPNYFVLVTQVSHGAAIDADAILEEFVRHAGGGAVASIGMSRTSFPSTTQAYVAALHQELSEGGAANLGEAMQSVLAAGAAAAQLTSAERHTQLAFTLLGDPLTAAGAQAILTAQPPATANRLHIESVLPNPFNPSTRIQFVVPGGAGMSPSVQVTIFDLAGRRLRALHDGPLASGRQVLSWDGRSDDGRVVASGSYFLSVQAAGQRRTTKLLLLK